MDNESKPAGHTPGPWKVGNDGVCAGIIDANPECIGIWAGHQQFILGTVVALATDGNKANAALLAAAPEMLYALEAVVNTGGWNLECWNIAKAAIAKAKGAKA